MSVLVCGVVVEVVVYNGVQVEEAAVVEGVAACKVVCWGSMGSWLLCTGGSFAVGVRCMRVGCTPAGFSEVVVV